MNNEYYLPPVTAVMG